MQALLSERDKALQDLKEERDDLERSLETLRAGLRERETAAGQVSFIIQGVWLLKSLPKQRDLKTKIGILNIKSKNCSQS